MAIPIADAIDVSGVIQLLPTSHPPLQAPLSLLHQSHELDPGGDGRGGCRDDILRQQELFRDTLFRSDDDDTRWHNRRFEQIVAAQWRRGQGDAALAPW